MKASDRGPKRSSATDSVPSVRRVNDLETDTSEAEYAEFSGLVSALADAVPPVDPPASLKNDIMQKISQTPQTVSAMVNEPIAPRAIVTDIRNRPRRRMFNLLVGLSAAAACVAGGVVLDRVILSPDSQIIEEASPGQGTSTVSANGGAIVSLASAPDVQRITAPVSGGGEAVLIWSASQGSAAFVGYDLSQISADEVLALWFVRDGVMVPAGTASVDAQGKSWAMLVGPMQAGDGFGMTIEPKGVTPSVETPPVLVVES